MTIRVHELKSWPPYFASIVDGRKTFEIRLNDRHYGIGDRLRLMEFDPKRREYSGREVLVRVTYLMPLEPLGIPGGYVGLGIER